MTGRSPEWPEIDVDDVVDAYETARSRDGHATIADHLPPAGHPRYLAILCELIRVELEYDWQGHVAKPLEHYRTIYPALFEDPDLVQDMAYEEYRLRLQAGDRPATGEYERRFGVDELAWEPIFDDSELAGLPGDGSTADPSELGRAASAYQAYRRGEGDSLVNVFHSRGLGVLPTELFREFDRSDPSAADHLARALSHLPEPGSEFLGFRLRAELGRGAFGRVYLARQGDLANRPVALKISADVGVESKALAQLQHTNVVPIYSVHRSGPLQAVCMPYLGSTTLADVISELQRHDALPESGRGLLSTLDERRRRFAGANGAVAQSPATIPTADRTDAFVLPSERTPAPIQSTAQLERLRGLGYVSAVLWVISRLADGLAHAHERGILHRDLKPANVLFSDDGDPMLLDFNLATDTKVRLHASVALVGGTLPYMSPEQLESFAGGTRTIDARSDIYALGVIFYEVLTGRLPFPTHPGSVDEILPLMVAERRNAPPSVRARNKGVTPAIEAIVRRCLDPDPAKRYGTARELQEDLRCQLEDRPLKHTAEPSLRERAGKWARRHPRLTSSTSVALFAACAIVALSAGLLAYRTRLAHLDAIVAARELADAVPRIDVLLGSRDADPGQVQEGIELCSQEAKRYRILEDPRWESSSLVNSLSATDRTRLRNDLGELLFLWGRAVSWQAGRAPGSQTREERIREARALNRAAESAFGSSFAPRALWLQRAELAELDGRADEARELRTQAEGIPLRSSRDRLLLITNSLDRERFGEALDFFRAASQRDPQNFATWLLLGNCHAGLGQYDDARNAYGVAIALRPDLQWLYFNRGVLALDHQQYPYAVEDFDRVLEIRPDLTVGYLNRALARLGIGDTAGAIADLDRVLQDRRAPTRALFIRGRAHDQAGNPDAARRDREEGLRREPNDELSWIARGVARIGTDPDGALQDFTMALRLNPRSLPALQNTASVLAERPGQTENAVRVLDRAITFHPSFVPALAGRGVLLGRLGRRELALKDALTALHLDRKPATVYQVAGIYALTSRTAAADRDEALRLLSEAIRADATWLTVIPNDPDLSPIRDAREFQDLIRALSLVTSPIRP